MQAVFGLLSRKIRSPAGLVGVSSGRGGLATGLLSRRPGGATRRPKGSVGPTNSAAVAAAAKTGARSLGVAIYLERMTY